MKKQTKITLAISALSLAIAFILTSCHKSNLFIPEAATLETAPTEVTTTQLHTDYMFDEEAANAKYTGKRLVFYELVVEEVVGAIYVGMEYDLKYLKDYFVSGSVRFYLKDYDLMQSVEEGYILNVVGKCQGLDHGVLKITDCWVESVVGELTNIVPDSEY